MCKARAVVPVTFSLTRSLLNLYEYGAHSKWLAWTARLDLLRAKHGIPSLTE